MAEMRIGTVFRQLAAEVGSRTDAQLLADHLTRRDPEALELLVRRHAGLVWGVCRRILRDPDAAEDAFQATFLVLIRRAGSISTPERLANWLHGVALQTSRKARAMAFRRADRERAVDPLPEPFAPESAAMDDLARILDEEISRLHRRERAVVLLCDLEGMNRAEVARQLGVPEGTVASRLARARARLADRLTRRGVGLTVAMLGTFLCQQATAAVPFGIVTLAVEMAMAGPDGGAIASPGARTLAEGVFKAMIQIKLKVASLAVVLVACAATTWAMGTRPEPNSPKPPEPPPSVQAGDALKVAFAEPNSPAAKADEQDASLDGIWQLVSTGRDSETIHFDKIKGAKNMYLCITGGRYTCFAYRNMRDAIEGKLIINSLVNPKTIDLPPGAGEAADQIKRYIYSVKGDELTLCSSETGLPRPKRFEAPKGSKFWLERWKRVSRSAPVTLAGQYRFFNGKVEIEATEGPKGIDYTVTFVNGGSRSSYGLLPVVIPPQSRWFIYPIAENQVLMYRDDRTLVLFTREKRPGNEESYVVTPRELKPGAQRNPETKAIFENLPEPVQWLLPDGFTPEVVVQKVKPAEKDSIKAEVRGKLSGVVIVNGLKEDMPKTVTATVRAGGYDVILDCSESPTVRGELIRRYGTPGSSTFVPPTVIVKGRIELRPVTGIDVEARPNHLVMVVDSLEIVGSWNLK